MVYNKRITLFTQKNLATLRRKENSIFCSCFFYILYISVIYSTNIVYTSTIYIIVDEQSECVRA